MQSLPANTILQLLGQSVATPASAPRADAVAGGNDAFATALELLLSGTPAANPGNETTGASDFASLLLSGGEAPVAGASPAPAQAVASAVLPAVDNNPQSAQSPIPGFVAGTIDPALLASLMPLMPSPAEASTTAAKAGSPAPVPTTGEISSQNNAAPTISRPNDSPIADPAAFAITSQTSWPLPLVPLAPLAPLAPLVSQPAGSSAIVSKPSQSGGVPTGVTSDPIATLTPREFVTVALPSQPHGLIVKDLIPEQNDGTSGEPARNLPTLDTPPMPGDDGLDPKLLQNGSVAKALSTKGAALPGSGDLNQAVLPAGSDSLDSAKSALPASTVPGPTVTIPNTPDRVLTAKILNTSNVPGISPEARILTSKTSELGVISLSVRQGDLQSKPADRLQALSAIDEDMLARAVAKEPAAIMAPKPQESNPRVTERPASSDDSARKKDDPAPPPAPGRPVDSPAKSSMPTPDASVRATEAPKQPVADRTEAAAPAPRFVVEDAKPIRVPGQITVRMEPAELGRMTIDLQAGQDGIIGRLRFASDAVRTTIERDISQLHRALTDAGVRVERLDIVGVTSTNERSGFSSQTPQDHQAPHREASSQGRNGESRDNSQFNNRERGHRQTPLWNTNQQSPWTAMASLASGLNLVA